MELMLNVNRHCLPVLTPSARERAGVYPHLECSLLLYPFFLALDWSSLAAVPVPLDCDCCGRLTPLTHTCTHMQLLLCCSLFRCSRSGDLVEPVLYPQWFLRMGDFCKMAIKDVETGALQIGSQFHESVWKE